MSIKLFVSILCIFFFLGTVPAFAEPIETVKTEYYEVHGANMKEVRKSIDQHSHMAHNFGNRDAMTTSKINPKWGNPPVVTVDITYIIPKWVEASQAPKDVQKKWQAYLEKLQLHEDGHRKIDEDCARAVEKRYIAEGPRPGRRFNTDINVIYQEYEKKQLEYDRVTKHGQLQGVEFPYDQ